MEDFVQGAHAVDQFDHVVDFGWLCIVFDLEEDDVFDGLG